MVGCACAWAALRSLTVTKVVLYEYFFSAVIWFLITTFIYNALLLETQVVILFVCASILFSPQAGWAFTF